MYKKLASILLGRGYSAEAEDRWEPDAIISPNTMHVFRYAFGAWLAVRLCVALQDFIFKGRDVIYNHVQSKCRQSIHVLDSTQVNSEFPNSAGV